MFCFLINFSSSLINGSSAGFLYGAPCSTRNTAYLSTHNPRMPHEAVVCVDMTHLPPKALNLSMDDITTAHTLYADHMYLKKIPVKILAHFPNLDLVDLSGNNIKYMYPRTFNKNPHLRKLLLSDNRVKTAKQKIILKQTSLTDLQLSRNKIKHLPVTIFSGLPSLKVLFLDGNQLSKINPKVFSRLSNLKYLHLGNNWLKTIPSNLVPKKAITLILKGNPVNATDFK